MHSPLVPVQKRNVSISIAALYPRAPSPHLLQHFQGNSSLPCDHGWLLVGVHHDSSCLLDHPCSCLCSGLKAKHSSRPSRVGRRILSFLPFPPLIPYLITGLARHQRGPIGTDGSLLTARGCAGHHDVGRNACWDSESCGGNLHAAPGEWSLGCAVPGEGRALLLLLGLGPVVERS